MGGGRHLVKLYVSLKLCIASGFQILTGDGGLNFVTTIISDSLFHIGDYFGFFILY